MHEIRIHQPSPLRVFVTWAVFACSLASATVQAQDTSDEKKADEATPAKRPALQIRRGATTRTANILNADKPGTNANDKAPTPAPTPASPPTTRDTNAPSDFAAPPTNIPPFETGIDYVPTSPRARVTFNLEDADLPDLVRLISNLTGKRFILSSKVRSLKATVFAPTQVTVAEAYNAFLSILEVNGMTVVPAGRYLKISETANIENQPIPLYTGDTPTPGSDRFITRLHRVENVSAEDAATLLSRFKSQAGAVTAYAPTNTLILTDTGTQIQRMLRLIEAVDVSRTGEQIWI
ncbi:MAG: hypothetical protein KC417_09520, partial [Myxococcales bacterium]|nr:hypothetical protein [Myxococcales bacterium]